MSREDITRFLRFAVGDLGPARRHLARLATGALPPSDAVLREIGASVERCVARLEAAAEPCGECHLQPGEVCDICGRSAPAAEA